MRDILETAARPPGRVKLGSLLSDIGRKLKLTEDEFAIFEGVRDKGPARAASRTARRRRIDADRQAPDGTA